MTTATHPQQADRTERHSTTDVAAGATPELSVVIVTLKDELAAIECYQHLATSDFDDYEVITRDEPGICAARNAGIKAAAADKIVFLDDDAAPCEGYLERVAERLDEYPIVTGRVQHTAADVLCDNAAGYDQGDEPRHTDTLIGCNMAFRREVFETVGYFDERLKWGHDEGEFADRAVEHYDIFYDPELVVEHAYAESARDYWRKMWRFGPADVYYGRISGAGHDSGTVLRTLFSPSQYLHPTVSGTVIKSVGRFLRNISIAKAALLSELPAAPNPDRESESTAGEPQ